MSHWPSLSLSSTRITCAPNAASTRVPPAPANCPVKSHILILDNAAQGSFWVVIVSNFSQRSQEVADAIEDGVVKVPVTSLSSYTDRDMRIAPRGDNA